MNPSRENREQADLAIANFSAAAQDLNKAIADLRQGNDMLGQIDATLRVNFQFRMHDGIVVDENDNTEKAFCSVLRQYHDLVKRLKDELAAANAIKVEEPETPK